MRLTLDQLMDFPGIDGNTVVEAQNFALTELMALPNSQVRDGAGHELPGRNVAPSSAPRRSQNVALAEEPVGPAASRVK